MLQINCYLEEEVECKGVLKSSALPWEPSRSLPDHWKLYCCLLLGRNVCAHTCVFLCVWPRCNTAPVALPWFISQPLLIRLWAESKEGCVGESFTWSGGILAQSMVFQKLFMLCPLKCSGMEKAKQINLKPTTVQCKDKLQGREGESEPPTSYPCLRNCPRGFSGASNEKSSRHTVPVAAGTKGVVPNPRLSIPAWAPCSAGDGLEHLPLQTRAVPQPMGSR